MRYYAIFVTKVIAMSDRVNVLIESIREKSMLLKDQLASEKAASEKLREELGQLKGQNAEKDLQIQEFQTRIAELNERIATAKQSNIGGSEESSISDEHIDELVKEIEYCIAQLKK